MVGHDRTPSTNSGIIVRMKLCGTTTCSNCPWLRSSPPGEFSPRRYVALKTAVQQGFGRMFACHKSHEGDEVACVGALLRGGMANFYARALVTQGRIDLSTLRATGPLYDCFSEMARKNGVREKDLQDLPDERQYIIVESGSK